MPDDVVLPTGLEWGVPFREGFPPIGALGHAGTPRIPPNTDTYPEPDPGIEPCDECGLTHHNWRGHASCAFHSNLGLPCRSTRVAESVACRKHGGNQSLESQRLRKRRVAEKKAAKSLAKVQVLPLGNPIDHLSDLAAEALAIKHHFADVVAELRQIGSPVHYAAGDDAENAELADLLNRRDGHGYRFTDDKGSEQLDARVALYERALDRAEKFLVNLVKIDFEERRTKLDEARVLLMMDFVRALVEGLGRRIDEPEVEALIRGLSPILDGEPRRPLLELDEVG